MTKISSKHSYRTQLKSLLHNYFRVELNFGGTIMWKSENANLVNTIECNLGALRNKKKRINSRVLTWNIVKIEITLSTASSIVFKRLRNFTCKGCLFYHICSFTWHADHIFLSMLANKIAAAEQISNSRWQMHLHCSILMNESNHFHYSFIFYESYFCVLQLISQVWAFVVQILYLGWPRMVLFPSILPRAASSSDTIIAIMRRIVSGIK